MLSPMLNLRRIHRRRNRNRRRRHIRLSTNMRLRMRMSIHRLLPLNLPRLLNTLPLRRPLIPTPLHLHRRRLVSLRLLRLLSAQNPRLDLRPRERRVQNIHPSCDIIDRPLERRVVHSRGRDRRCRGRGGRGSRGGGVCVLSGGGHVRVMDRVIQSEAGGEESIRIRISVRVSVGVVVASNGPVRKRTSSERRSRRSRPRLRPRPSTSSMRNRMETRRRLAERLDRRRRRPGAIGPRAGGRRASRASGCVGRGEGRGVCWGAGWGGRGRGSGVVTQQRRGSQ